MKKEIMELWVEALESGKYKKGICSLNRNNESYCCMGVLCEVAIENGVPLYKQQNNKYVTYDGREGYCPIKVMDWAGIKSESGKFSDDGNSLTSLNDLSDSFAPVIEAIKKNWKIL